MNNTFSSEKRSWLMGGRSLAATRQPQLQWKVRWGCLFATIASATRGRKRKNQENRDLFLSSFSAFHNSSTPFLESSISSWGCGDPSARFLLIETDQHQFHVFPFPRCSRRIEFARPTIQFHIEWIHGAWRLETWGRFLAAKFGLAYSPWPLKSPTQHFNDFRCLSLLRLWSSQNMGPRPGKFSFFDLIHFSATSKPQLTLPIRWPLLIREGEHYGPVAT